METESFATAVADDAWLLAAGSELLIRRRLIARLVATQAEPLAVLIAPAGYGKTVLIDQWSLVDPRPFRWLRAADVERDPEIVAARGTEPGPSVTVIDDAHELAPDLLRRAIAQALAELLPGSLVVVASRQEPTLGLGRLRAHRMVVELRTADLAFSSAEGAVLLRRAGLRLTVAQSATLMAKTEGWPAALHLASLSLGAQADTAAAVENFSGDDHLVREYIWDEFLAGLTAGELRFLTETSVLRELSAKACGALLLRDGSGGHLTKLTRSIKLLQPIDASHDQYRLHPLLRDALKAEFRQAQPRRKAILQQRASAWHAARGDVTQAIDHAVAAGDAEFTGELLLPHLVAYAYGGRHETVRRWLNGFSDKQISESRSLAVARAHVHLVAGEVDAAHRWTALARESEQPLPELVPQDAAMTVLDGLLTATDMTQLLAVTPSTDAGDTSSGHWAPLSAFLAGSGSYLSGDPTGAEAYLDRGVRRGRLVAPTAAALCMGQLIVIALERSEPETAVRLCEESLALVAEHDLGSCGVMSLVFAACAAAYAVSGHADEAKLNVRRSSDLLACCGEFAPWYGAETRLLLARASLWLADIIGARTLLADASRLARRASSATLHQQWFDDAWAQLDTLAETSLAGPSALSIAELRVLRFLPSHRSFREIGMQLGVSSNTIKTQVHAIYRKLDSTSRSEAVARASELGLLGS